MTRGGWLLAIVGVVGVLGLVGVWVWGWGGEGAERPVEAKRVVEKKPAVKKRAVAKKPEVKKEAKRVEAARPVAAAGTNGAERVLTQEEKLEILRAEALKRANRDTTIRTRTERSLRLLSSVRPGLPVPPMPPGMGEGMDDDLEATLANKIEILEGDTEAEIEQKQFVMAFKEVLKEEAAKGRRPSEVFWEYVHLMNRAAAIGTEGLKMAKEFEAGGDKAGAAEILRQVNLKLEEMGAPPVEMHRRPKGKPKKKEEAK